MQETRVVYDGGDGDNGNGKSILRVDGPKFHLIRDHPSHSGYSVSGGLWGGTRNCIPNMKELLVGFN